LGHEFRGSDIADLHGSSEFVTGNERPEPVFGWFLPIDGDGSRIGTLRAEREPTFDYLLSVAQAAEDAGYTNVLVPTRLANGSFDEVAPLAETWTMTAAIAARTEKLRYLVAVRPGPVATGLFARMAATFDQLSNGRLDLNVVPGGIEGDMERLGEKEDHDTRYERAAEFIEAMTALWSGKRTTYEGRHVVLRDAISSPTPHSTPAIYTGGASPAALELAARYAGVFLAWIQTQDKTAALITRSREAFAKAGREPRLGLRTHIVLGDTEEAARAAATDLISNAHPDVIAQRHRSGPVAAVGRSGQTVAVPDHWLSPRLWNGISEVRVNLGTAIVGTPRQVAEELAAYWRLGFDDFILSGYPHLEEAGRVSRQVLPIFRELIAT
jgi:alkanesulfonate monooxygenase